MQATTILYTTETSKYVRPPYPSFVAKPCYFSEVWAIIETSSDVLFPNLIVLLLNALFVPLRHLLSVNKSRKNFQACRSAASGTRHMAARHMAAQHMGALSEGGDLR